MKRIVLNLNKEKSENFSGVLLNENHIPLLKESDYYIQNVTLDGDAPKQFIRAYFYEEGSTVRKKNLSSWIPFIAKTAEKWYPIESVVEFMINRIGEELGLKMNKVKLIKANGQIRFLSRYFLNERERLVHGAEICGEHLEDVDFARQIAVNKDTARELFTFEFICKAIESVYPDDAHIIILDLVKMIAFDGIVGNNDRHFYNWGVIDNLKKSKKTPKFAPIFDSARGLLWNTSDDGVKRHKEHLLKGGKKIVHYIDRACPRISIEENKEANHFELLSFLKNRHTNFGIVIENLASLDNEKKVKEMLKREFFPFFIKERQELIEHILSIRFQKVREV